jgi:hypothetical protein
VLEAAVWISTNVAAAVIGAVVGALLSDQLQTLAGYVAEKTAGPTKERGIDGLWAATFEVPGAGGIRREYTEIVKVTTRFGLVVGRLIDHDINRRRRPSLAPGSVRLRGRLRHRKNFLGTWFHPEPTNPICGSFYLELDGATKQLSGHWAGPASDGNGTASGTWRWQRVSAAANAIPDSEPAQLIEQPDDDAPIGAQPPTHEDTRTEVLPNLQMQPTRPVKHAGARLIWHR